ncbi:RNHCP domain-containing protein [Natronosporangium hydrolyticum]|uniref:RNHCP domain-containing protein n=1 Tax=Natronosporangium hydrolyticum TaxID=2811111 RepID=A0A895Y751_9ACTN|nr:RNHCP domain-containing protein [Natronosporangium hydrolyticum]QSB13191.1 RNHCP domain-containing protein [Natronosporangium hydrolyticum]
MSFTRMVEDFVCEHCATRNVGNGYTNHCAHCLHSKHVDVDPGDRAADCQGLMVPVGVDTAGGGTSLLHRCDRCGAERRCKTAPEDDQDAIVAVATQPPPPIPRQRPRRRRHP